MENSKKTVEEVYYAIIKRPNPADVTKEVVKYLIDRFARSKLRQEAAGVLVELTFEQFLSIISAARFRKMEAMQAQGRLDVFMRGKETGYVLSWRNRDALLTKTMNVDTASFCNRRDSIYQTRLRQGDKHREDSKDLIRKKRTGTTQKEATKAKIGQSKIGIAQSDEHVAKRAAALTGQTRSEEAKARMKAAATARWARNRGEMVV